MKKPADEQVDTTRLRDENPGPGEKPPGKGLSPELQKKLEKTNRALRAISRCNEAMIRTTEEAILLKTVCDIIVEFGGYKMAWIGYILNDPGRTVKPVANSGLGDGYLENLKIALEDNVLGRGPVGIATRTKKPVVVRDVMTDPGFAPWRSRAVEKGFASMISLPLIADSKVIGVLSIDSEKTDAFGDEDIVLLQELANNLAFGIKSIRSRVERDHAEEALRESEEKFRALAESSTAAILIIQGDKFVNLNKAAEMITGYSEQELFKMNFWEPIHPEFRELVRKRAEARQRGEPEPLSYEIALVTKSGETKWVQMTVSRIRYQGKPALVATLFDITERRQTEEALRESEEKFKALAESSTAAIFVYQGEHYVSVNEAAAKMTGYSQAELLKLNIMDIIHPDFKELVRQRARARQLGEPAPPIYEAKIVTKSGEVKWVLLSAARIVYGGKPAGVATLVDITERKRTEETLLLTQFAMDRAPDASIWADKDGRITYVNDAACEATGYSRGEFLLMHIWDFDRGTSEEKFKKMWSSLSNQDRQRVGARFETVARAKSGRFYPVEVTTEYFSFKGTGHLISFGRDISGRKQAEKERERLLYEIDGQRRRLQTILESLPVGLFIVHTGGRIEMANHIALKYRGGTFPSTLDELAKTKMQWADTGNVVRKEEMGIFKSLSRGEIITNETVEIEDAKGNPVTLLCSSAPLPDAAGNITGAVSISLDITEMRKLEQDLGKSKRQAELYLDLMSHDIANLNHALLGYLELMSISTPSGTEESDMIGSSLEIINRSSRIIGQVKKLTRLKAEMAPQKEVDVCKMLAEIKARYSEVPGRQVTISYTPGQECMVRAGELLADALENLVDNAIRHSTGPVTVELAADRVVVEGRERLRIAIADTGPGIPDDLKAKIFMSLEELEEKKTRRGFGLYFVRTVVDHYHGKVWVEDRVPGDYTKGSKFVVQLPASDFNRA